MNQALIENWNKKVRPSDEVYHLGDFAFCKYGEDPLPIFKQLNGRITLLRGNHDKWTNEDLPFYREIKYFNQKIILCHYPILEWNGKQRGSWHLFGHIHNTEFQHPAKMCKNVGVDNNDFTPVSFEEIKEEFNNV
jgi:calcineurin-like phosphoesterase family protein